MKVSRPLVLAVAASAFLALAAACSSPAATQTPRSTSTPTATATPQGGTPVTPGGTPGGDLAEQGKQLATTQGCVGCHTVDGTPLVGPTWKGVYGREEELTDGSKVTVNDVYIAESIRNPNAKVVKNFQPVMIAFPNMTDDQIKAIIEYMKTLK